MAIEIVRTTGFCPGVSFRIVNNDSIMAPLPYLVAQLEHSAESTEGFNFPSVILSKIEAPEAVSNRIKVELPLELADGSAKTLIDNPEPGQYIVTWGIHADLETMKSYLNWLAYGCDRMHQFTSGKEESPNRFIVGEWMKLLPVSFPQDTLINKIYLRIE